MTESSIHYNSFWTSKFVTASPTADDLKNSLENMKGELVIALSRYLIETGSVDMAVVHGMAPDGKTAGHTVSATVNVLNPRLAISNDIFVHERMKSFAEDVVWPDEETKEVFSRMLETAKPKDYTIQ